MRNCGGRVTASGHLCSLRNPQRPAGPHPTQDPSPSARRGAALLQLRRSRLKDFAQLPLGRAEAGRLDANAPGRHLAAHIGLLGEVRSGLSRIAPFRPGRRPAGKGVRWGMRLPTYAPSGALFPRRSFAWRAPCWALGLPLLQHLRLHLTSPSSFAGFPSYSFKSA